MVVYKLLMCPTSNHHQNFQSFDVCKTSLEYAIDKEHMVKVFKMILFTFFFRQERVQTVQSGLKRSQSILSYSANDHCAHRLHSNLKKAQRVAAMSGDFLTPPF